MANIVLTRIDERLLHGQVRITWGKHSGANTILIANDEVAGNPILQAPFKGAAGGEYHVLFRTVEQAIQNIPKAGPERKILLLCNNPTDVAALAEGGVPISEVNIGNMHYHPGKTKVDANVCVDKKDMIAFEKLRALGIPSTIQHMPESTKQVIFDVVGEAVA
ncbi:PTS system mannose/fructose/N-acetylgalactosamine-transporter subunit IIB [Photobacterium aphoticum]|uniref:PTS system N-acetylgalactosamine-specific transporter subunit IIB n=1 Tax=Photobacterium aphoticum TaxID=754436 RepID=A0A0J1GGG3_9GAMM|nr:PTS system mannose/fructose/N-acetylgalactosamine-transporter subunit IIB [Photobacterium aphoticum]KLU98598.1 PTS system N-acetylgalactosamine-specific transporter subunit IIB [Photobacterium aphoticum]PSU57515.1 PTS mannose/fructose/sorbose transporter subunit IIB [Photobacterium aphoticum]GHA62527.1 PTS N-acetylgalactosamine transporter subunit IIB [Photobacterium aphoticum]